MRAIVVFCEGEGWRSGVLKRGFGHCFVVVNDGLRWVTIDAAKGVPIVSTGREAGFNLANWHRSHGTTIIETEQRKEAPIGPFCIANCVGMVKAVLAIRAPFVLTPYQLYRYLVRYG